ncbi:MAG: Sec-independent protein translocase subunit TatC [Gammaproteobacteria bacterium]|nr:MAG: Sec-independent protein translocase subunit TatC [Gammaproteobacteria bacterium]
MTQADKNLPPEESDEQPFISHLIELRDRLLRVVLVVIVIFLGLAPFANWLFTQLAGPLMAHLPEGSSMVAIDVASPFFTPFKLALVLAIFISMPVILYQLWGFIAPGLYQHERKRTLPLLVSSTALFYLGAAFAYYAVFPLVFGFLANAAPQGVEVMTDISRYLDFVLTLFFAFGVAFEIPVAVVLLVWTGAVKPKAMREKRAYVIVGAFVIGMLLTPPDIISQTLLALPMWILFEVGVFMGERFAPKKDEEDSNDSGHGEYEPPTDEEMEAELDRIDREEEGRKPE